MGMPARILGLALVLVTLVPASADAACHSRAVGLPNNGRLVCGVQLPGETDALVTWDGVLGQGPNRDWRRWGTSKLVDTIEKLSVDYGVRFPIGPRLVVGDLSRRHGGPFGVDFGGVGHASHQNGLDVDIYYPRLDGLEQPPEKPSLIDRRRRPVAREPGGADGPLRLHRAEYGAEAAKPARPVPAGVPRQPLPSEDLGLRQLRSERYFVIARAITTRWISFVPS